MTFYCKRNTPIRLETGEVLVLKTGQYLEVSKLTEQVAQYVKTGVLEKRNAPHGVTIISSKNAK